MALWPLGGCYFRHEATRKGEKSIWGCVLPFVVLELVINLHWWKGVLYGQGSTEEGTSLGVECSEYQREMSTAAT